MNVHEQNIQNALSRICQSKMFLQSEMYVFILRFLVNSYLSGETVKEIIIETELSKQFKNKVSIEGNVRVYMFNLRKKLDEYYLTDGAKDSIQFEIKKGQYNLSVSDKPRKTSSRQTNKSNVWRRVLFVILSGLPFLLWILFRTIDKPGYCWKEFFKNGANTICYVGDHFVAREQINNDLEASVHFEMVNTVDEFNKVIRSGALDSSRYTVQNYSFITKMGPISAAKLSNWFTKYKSSFEVFVATDFVSDNVSNHNIVYVGPPKTMNNLSRFFLLNSTRYAMKDKRLFDLEKNEELTRSISNNIWEEFVMVSYNALTGNGRSILFFASEHDIGVMATVTNFTNRDWLKEFYKNLPDKSVHFNALFLVKGVDRTNIESELIGIEVLK